MKVNRFIDSNEAGWQVGPGCASGWSECSRQAGGVDPKNYKPKRTKVRYKSSSVENTS